MVNVFNVFGDNTHIESTKTCFFTTKDIFSCHTTKKKKIS